MSWLVWTIVGVLGLVVGYLLVMRLWYGQSTVLQSSTLQLKDSQPASVSNLTSPTANAVTVMFWMYVNTWATGATRTVMSFGSGATTDWSLSMDPVKPLLIVKVGAKTFTCTSNFPMQKWTMVTIVFDNSTIDMYVDDGLTESFTLDAPANFNSTQLTYGTGLDVALASVRRYPNYAYAPSQVKSSYYSNNNKMQALKYGVQVTITQNDQAASQWTIF